jgi:hypothetical protein
MEAVKKIQLVLLIVLVAAILGGDAQVRDPLYFGDLLPEDFLYLAGHFCCTVFVVRGWGICDAQNDELLEGAAGAMLVSHRRTATRTLF